MRVLVAYATVHGSTAQVAQAIAGVVAANGIALDIAAANALPAGAHHDAYIFGSAVRSGLWLPEMAHLARRLRGELANAPFYLWLNCLRVIETDGLAHVMRNYVPDMLSGLPRPRAIAVFGGRFDASQLDADESWTLSFRYDGADLPARIAGDHRDWNAIRAWANEVAAELKAFAA